MRLFSNLRITRKIVLLVALLGALSIIITVYLLANLYAMDRDYRALLDRDAKASLLISDALLDLSDSSRLVLLVLSEQEEARMRETQQRLEIKQAKFDEKLARIAPLLPDAGDELDSIRLQKHKLFELANSVIDSAARWRGDRALTIIHQQFDPTLNAMRQDIEALRNRTVDKFNSAAQALTAATERTLINISITFTLALTIIIGLSAHVSLTQISRPIKQLTKAMARLSRREYDHPIKHTERQDEVGSMALTLQVFRDSMRRADQLEREAIVYAENRRISQQLIDLTDAMPGAVFQLRVAPHGGQQFVFLSGEAERYIGHTPVGTNQASLRLEHIRVVDSPEQSNTLDDAIEQSLQHLKPLDIEMQVEHGGRRFWLKTLATVRKADDGATLVNGIWLDVSEAKAQALALERAKEQADQAVNAKAAFLATMSHEIRTPMNAILGLTQVILKHPLEPRQRWHVEKIVKSGHHLMEIINDILDFTKVEGGHLVAEHIAFSPQQLLEDTFEMLEGKALSKGIILNVESASALPTLIGDPLRISQILLNYTDNAIKFSDHGAVTLSLDLQRDAHQRLYLYGEVKDQGIGLSEAQQNKLFEPFQQADTSITRRFGGTGLGLAISRSLAELMGGSVGVHSTPERGSRFWFRVRVGAFDVNQPLPVTVPTNTIDKPALAGLRVLLVDDNELNRLVASEFLQEVGIEVEEAEDGQVAIQLLEDAKNGTYDAVLMDMMMPELDGLSATRLLRKQARFSNLPIIAITANASSQDAHHCREAGMNAHLSKPLDQALLWGTLAQLCLEVNAVLEPPREPAGTTTTGKPILDPLPLERLKQLVTPERFAGMLTMLVEDCLQRGQRFSELADAANHQRLRQEAHDLISTAGHAGLRALESQAHALKHALDDADNTPIRRLCLNISRSALLSVDTLKHYFNPRN